MDKLFIVYSLEGDPYDSIVGLFQAEDIEKVKEYLSPDFKIKPFENPYGKRGLSKKIVEELEK